MPMTAAELVADRYRQIHLDFHTAPQIPDVGKDFDADAFAETLEAARVNWVTLFGKCHHGMSYYPTQAGTMHPSLKFDLLGAQIEACKKRGIATPVYISVRVDQHIGLTRPDLICRFEDGKLWGPDAHQASWYQVCLNNKEYIDYVAAQTEEVFKNYDADGIFYDMCYFPPRSRMLLRKVSCPITKQWTFPNRQSRAPGANLRDCPRIHHATRATLQGFEAKRGDVFQFPRNRQCRQGTRCPDAS